MLTISGLTYRVGGRHGRALLNEANAQIPDGSKLGLVGRNGAGKSTLLDLIRGRLLWQLLMLDQSVERLFGTR